ncbi:hypothetical protein ACQKM2_07165 [Streptomyces sp. NPDC004126]|uniref:hypothetical protein n=1 Tax=Streptomyces sp. NPDC004126 TaxID=3390695 RepID=UPI003CFC439B
MLTSSLLQRISALGTVLGLGLVLPFGLGVTPAYAQAQLEITKTHEGSFPRNGQGIYTVTVTNVGNEATPIATLLTDTLPEGLLVAGFIPSSDVECEGVGTRLASCTSGILGIGQSYVVRILVAVAADAPCTVTNSATVTAPFTGLSDSVTDEPTTITGGDCDNGGNGNGNGGGSILPVNVSGVLPAYNNITTNNNINSPGAGNVSRQNLGVSAP